RVLFRSEQTQDDPDSADAARRGHSGGTDPCGPCPGGTRSRWPYPRGDRALGPRGAVARVLRRLGPAPPNLGRTLRADARHKATEIGRASKTYAVVRSERLDLILMPSPLLDALIAGDRA